MSAAPTSRLHNDASLVRGIAHVQCYQEGVDDYTAAAAAAAAAGAAAAVAAATVAAAAAAAAGAAPAMGLHFGACA
ncbi:hypothetical protein OEZ86_008738 [Tetradesmus obliquus]|nr:hypothetical protein OEZ86_008738 [Tetradesmus obliquus]